MHTVASLRPKCTSEESFSYDHIPTCQETQCSLPKYKLAQHFLSDDQSFQPQSSHSFLVWAPKDLETILAWSHPSWLQTGTFAKPISPNAISMKTKAPAPSSLMSTQSTAQTL